MSNKSGKGASFERFVCVQLSEWWSKGRRQDIFWRTSMSGGRATVRSKKGKATFGAYGDITAVDPIGRPLTEYCTIELKRGYRDTNFGDSLDKATGKGPTPWERFVTQAIREKEPKARHWMLVLRRDHKRALAFIPLKMFNELRKYDPTPWFDPRPCPCVMMTLPDFVHEREGERIEIIGMKLTTLLKRMTPTTVKDLISHG